MPEIAKKYLERIKEFWAKYNTKQRTIFLASLSVIIIAMAILIVVVSKPVMVTLRYCASEEEVVEVRELLTSNGIECSVDENWVVSVNTEDEIEAKLVLGSNNLSSTGYTIEEALSGGFSTTESDKEKRYTVYLEDKFEKQLEQIDGIKKATVIIEFVDTGSTIFSENTDAFISATLDTTKTLSNETVEGIAGLLACNVGSNNTNNVNIIDTTGVVLYSGLSSSSDMASASTAYKYKAQLEGNLENEIREALISTRIYQEVTITANLAFDNDKVTQIVQEYTAPAGTENGLPNSTYDVESSGTNGSGGVAGTESNDDDTGYLITDGTSSNSEYTLNDTDWLQNSTYTTTEKAAGSIINEDSTVSLVAVKYNHVTEAELRAQGLLDDMTYEQYQILNRESVKLEVDEELVTMVANAANIPIENIIFVAYQHNIFEETEEAATPMSFYIQIALAALIVLLLAFVVFRSARPVTVSETEPELSVEDMLASTREKQAPLEEIDLNDKSEARKAIEKFVQENPEAVALLLRNWLNEGWD